MEKQNFIQTNCRSASTNNSSSNILSFPLVSSSDRLRSNLETARVTRLFPDEPHRSTLVITQPIIEKLSSDTNKREQFQPEQLSRKDFQSENHLKIDSNRFQTLISVPAIPSNTCEITSNASILAMNNVNGHLFSALNSSQLTDVGVGAYLVPMTNLKQAAPSSTDLPSPSSSSNSSNGPSTTPQTSTRRHGEGKTDSNRKREMRLQKNREAARECRRKKKEYIRCLEERVASLEAQNKALIEELRHLKELYCQREDTNNKTTNSNTTGVNKR